ncbi:MAG: hypothetical protein KA419_00830 [Acidobacteria bacterium]|nr:hypothetical protein [Acidobacteriota bacterium]
MTRTVFSLLLASALTLAAVSATPAPSPAPGRPLVFFVQKDIRPTIDNFDFEDGFTFLMKSLPADRQVVFVSLLNNIYTEEYSGAASSLSWPPGGFYFEAPSAATTPYMNIYRYLRDHSIQDTTVFLVSNGVSQDLIQYESSYANDRYSFLPDRFPTVSILVDYCKTFRVRIVGFLVWKSLNILNKVSGDEKDDDSVFRDSLVYVTKATRGEIYWNFSTFKGVFKSAMKKHMRK